MAGVAIVGTEGLAAVAVVASGASAAARLGELIGSLSFCTNDVGQILEGSPNVFINGKPAALAHQSTVGCDKHGLQRLAEGSSNVFINDRPVSSHAKATAAPVTAKSARVSPMSLLAAVA